MIQCSVVTTSVGGDVTPVRGKEETMTVDLTRILLDRKIKKIHVVDSAASNRR
jgi:hypothetical protein